MKRVRMQNARFMQRLRKGGAFTMLAMYALVLEIFFSSIHAATTAAVAAGPVRNPDSFIFMICTPQGLRLPSAEEARQANTGNDNRPSRKAVTETCPVCGSAAVSLFFMGRPPLLAAETTTFVRALFVQPEERFKPRVAYGLGHIRAPPLS